MHRRLDGSVLFVKVGVVSGAKDVVQPSHEDTLAIPDVEDVEFA